MLKLSTISIFQVLNLNFNNQSSDNESTPSDDEVDVSEGAENFDEQKIYVAVMIKIQMW